jgi:dTDP-4-amino-4,6-dideoxygalactose transaminase
MRDSFLPFSPPFIGDEEISEVTNTLQSDWITTGPKTQRFEALFAEYMGQPSAGAFNSWTSAAHTALVCAGIGPGDEVIVPTMTFAATANIVEHVGAKPVIVDVEPDTLNIDPERIREALTSRTRAIIPVHFAGHPAEMDQINAIADEHGLFVLEDAAHALPSKYRGEMIGGGRNMTAFSFYATKNLATAEGGMLIGGNPEILEKARIAGLHGMSRASWNRYGKGGAWRYDVVMPGFKYNMTDIAAGLGIHQLARLPVFQARRAEIAAQYQNDLFQIEGLTLPTVRSHVETCWHLFVVQINEEEFGMHRDQVIEELAARNIGSSVHFIPLHMHSFYRDKYNLMESAYPVASKVFQRILSLPLSPKHNRSDIEDVCVSLREIKI